MCKSRFRPCIDLHRGTVKQIVGSSLSESDPDKLKTNFVSRQASLCNALLIDQTAISKSYPPSYYAQLYREHNLTGGHVIMLGPGNVTAAKEALRAWPGNWDSYFDIVVHLMNFRWITDWRWHRRHKCVRMAGTRCREGDVPIIPSI